MTQRPSARLRTIALLLAGLAAAGACSTGSGSEARSGPETPVPETTDGAETGAPPVTTVEQSAGTAPPTTDSPATTVDPSAGTAPTADPDNLLVSLTAEGQELAGAMDWTNRPRYGLRARLDPDSGRVDGAMRARLPVGAAASEVHLRWFPGAAAEEAQLGDVEVDGVAVEPIVAESMATIALGAAHGDMVEVTARFSFTAPDFDPAQSGGPSLGGDALQPADIGLLARSEDALTLGHWFPVWVPDGLSADPELDGYGDIANFPAATIVAELEVPDATTVVTSGSRLDAPTDARQGLTGAGEATSIVEGGLGLRDLAVVVMRSASQSDKEVGGTSVVVTAPDGSAEQAAVLDEAAASLATLSDAFGVYPWAELDVVSAPLGSGVGGMEWPGMVWIESTIFDGGVPGMGDMSQIFGDGSDLGELFGEGSDLGELFGEGSDLSELFGEGSGLEDLLGGSLGDIGLTIETLREWTVAHEVGHMWWHSVVGNDSLVAPVIDEALAQHSACLVERELRQDDADTVCAAQTSGQYQQMRSMMGVADGAADRPSDEFDSSLQYGAVVYGKAPGLYRELERRYGVDETTDALAAVVAEHAFEQITPDDLRSVLGEALGDADGVDRLWRRWLDEQHGDEDLTD